MSRSKSGSVMAKQARELIPAVAYLRTSSAANVGADKDSERRQREAIQGFARRAGYEIVDEFYDAAVSGVAAKPPLAPGDCDRRRCARAPHCRARRVRIDHRPMLMRSPLARDRRRRPASSVLPSRSLPSSRL